MNSAKEVSYRIELAKGFLKEAEQDYDLGRWRSCVDNAQLAVENAGKAILSLFGISPKTHDPAKHLERLSQNPKIPVEVRDLVKNALPDFISLGFEEHFMTDYGDEASYRLPWEIFTQDSAEKALTAARRCTLFSERVRKRTDKLFGKS